MNPLYETLVTQMTGINQDNDEANFRIAVDFVAKNLDQTVKPSGSADMTDIDKQFKG